MDILLASVMLVVFVKTAVATVVAKAFGYSIRTSFQVGLFTDFPEEFSFMIF